MKSFKILSNSSVFISKQKPKNNFNNSRHLIAGQYNSDEFRCLIDFCLNPKIFDFKVSKADLVIYLDKTEIDSNIEAFMLNICRNLDNFDSNTVNFENAPKFFQEAHFSKIEASYSNNSIIIDVSKLLDYWIKNKITSFGLTLVGLAQNSVIYLSNSIKKKPFLEIYLDDNTDNSEINQDKIENKKHNKISTPPINNSNSNKSKIDEIYKNYKEHNQVKSQERSNLSSLRRDSVACGNFISTNGELLKNESVAYVKFDSENNAIKTNLTLHKDGIYILYKGLYKVDFFVNCRSQTFSTVELELDDVSLPMTQIQISTSDSPTYSSTIIEIPDDNMILKLKISTINSMLINNGICASLNLMKIN